jgi:hypothetical protein
VRRLILTTAVLVLGCAVPKPVEQPPAIVEAPAVPQPLVSFVRMSNQGLPAAEAERIAALIFKVSGEFQLDVPLFAAIIRHESHFRTGIKACRFINNRRTCDYGIAQVNTFWVDELELDAARLRTDDLYNMRIAAKILKDVLERHPGRLGYSYYNTADPELRIAYSDKVEKYRRLAMAD